MTSVNNCLQLLLHKWLLRKQSIILPTVAVFSELLLWQPECQFSFCKSTWCPHGRPFPVWCNTLMHAMHTEVVFCHVQLCSSCSFFSINLSIFSIHYQFMTCSIWHRVSLIYHFFHTSNIAGFCLCAFS